MGTTKRERQKANRQQRLEELAKAARKDKTRRTATLVSVVVVGALVLLFGLAFLFGDDDDAPASQPTTAQTLPVTTLDPAAVTTVDQSTTSTTEGPTTTVAVPFTYGAGACPAADGSSELPETLEAPAKCIDEAKGYVATVKGTRGAVPFEFEITLDAAKSPGNVNNFVTLARYGYYEGTDCHRIIKDFVVQCGRRGGDEEAPGYTVGDELPAPDAYSEGVVAMANRGADTNGAQFFIITGQQGADLPPSYTVLGRITNGYEGGVSLLEQAADPLSDNGVPPLFEVTIESVTITELDSPPETTVPTTTTTTVAGSDDTATDATATSGTTGDTTDIPNGSTAGTSSGTGGSVPDTTG